MLTADEALTGFRAAEASFRLDPSSGTVPALIEAAVALLVSGSYGSHLVDLAGDEMADWREVQRDLDGALSELGLRALTDGEAVLVTMSGVAQEVAARQLDAWQGLTRIVEVWSHVPVEDLGVPERQFAAVALEYLDMRGKTGGPSEPELVALARWYVEQDSAHVTSTKAD